MISYGRQSISSEDIEAVKKTLKSDFLTQGPKVPEFEQKIAKFTRSKYAVAVNSGTSALHISCLALGLTKGDYLWTSAISFVASANCGLYCGAQIDLIDINQHDTNINLDALEVKLRLAKKNKQLPKIIVPVHMCGKSADMKKLFNLSKKYKFKIIEDASHALGSKYNNSPIGNCRYSSMAVFSFHPVKSITSGEGGIVVTNNKDLFKKLKLFRTHGIISSQELSKIHKKKILPWHYKQVELGFNYRMSDISAALAISQLKRINYFISNRQKIAKKYTNEFKDLPIRTVPKNEIMLSSNHLYILRINSDLINKSNIELYNFLNRYKIKLNIHYIPIYKHPYFQKMKFKKKNFPNSEKFYSEALSLPIYNDLSIKDQNKVISLIKKFFSK